MWKNVGEEVWTGEAPQDCAGANQTLMFYLQARRSVGCPSKPLLGRRTSTRWRVCRLKREEWVESCSSLCCTVTRFSMQCTAREVTVVSIVELANVNGKSGLRMKRGREERGRIDETET